MNGTGANSLNLLSVRLDAGNNREEINEANQRANTAGCCGCIHQAAMYVEIVLVVVAIVLVILGATGVIAWLYAGIGLVLCVVVAGAIGIAYNRAYINLGTLKALVDDLQGEVSRLNSLVANLEGTLEGLRGENDRYVAANADHERVVNELRQEVNKQVEVNAQLQESLTGYQAALKRYEALVELFDGKIHGTVKELSEQQKRVESAATELEALEVRMGGCLAKYESNLEISKGVAQRAQIALRQFIDQVDLDAENLKVAEENEKTQAANLEKEKELNQRQEEMLNQQQLLLHQLTEVSNHLEENTKEYETLNKDFDLTKDELDEFRKKINNQETVIKKVEDEVRRVLDSINNPSRVTPISKEEVQALGDQILMLVGNNSV